MISDQVRELPAVTALLQRHESAVIGGSLRLGELSLDVDGNGIADVARFLKENAGFGRLSGITAVDNYPAEPRFQVVYLLHSLERRSDRIRLKCALSGHNPKIESLVSVWCGANWYEREVFDLFGIEFLQHPHLTRIMMPEDWPGHPLRKDYPIHGYRYSYADDHGGVDQ